MKLNYVLILGLSTIGYAFADTDSVKDVQWNPEYAKEHALENQPISAESFEQIEAPIETELEHVVIEKSLMDRLFGNLGPQGVGAQPWYLNGPIRPAIPAAVRGTKHAVGRHECWSREAIYSCNVELFDAFDCSEAGIRLKLKDCCPTYILEGKRLTEPRSMSFKLTKCGALGERDL